MDLRELTYIITIAEERSISRAADKLYMAQSSLSQFLQQYESELGITLFVRTSQACAPPHPAPFLSNMPGRYFSITARYSGNFGTGKSSKEAA